MMKKRLISMLLVLSMCFGLMTSTYAASASDFSDLKAGAWYMEYIPYMIEQGYMDGTGYGKFEPNATLTRATFVTILGRIAGVKESSYNTASQFSDVAKGQWYAPYVNWAVKKGITDGTGTSTFSPNQAITREQMAAMIYRYIKAYGLKPWDSYIALSEFEDYITVSFYAQKAVDLVRDSGIMFGKDDDKFHPKDYATRAEAAAVCYRLIAATEKNTENIFAEIPSSFVYNPGAVWLTSFNLQSNGTFEGNWHTSSAWNDRAIGDFTGKFSTPQRVSEHVYAMRLEYVYPDKTYAEEYIKEGWNVIDGIMEAGFADANDALFYIYLPGLAISELPDYARFALTKDEQNQQYLTRHMIYRKGCELAYWS